VEEDERPDPEKRREGGLGRHWIPRSVLFYSSLVLIVAALIISMMKYSEHDPGSPLLRDLAPADNGWVLGVVILIAAAVILMAVWALMRKKE